MVRAFSLSCVCVVLLAGCADVATAKHNIGTQNFTTAISDLQALSARGYPEAMVELGQSYLKGVGLPKDAQKAIALFREADALGHARAAFELGRAHEKGTGVVRSGTQALKMYEIAAERGHARALVAQANLYARGKLVRRDIARAEKLYQAALKAGQAKSAHDYAEFLMQQHRADEAMLQYLKAYQAGQLRSGLRLAEMHLRGVSVPADSIRAAGYVLAVQSESAQTQTDSDDLQVGRNLKRLMAGLTPETHLAAQKMARQILAEKASAALRFERANRAKSFGAVSRQTSDD